MDYDRRVEIRNELLEMGATVSNPGTRPQTVIDIGSQFETFSSLAGRTPQRPLFRPKTTPARSTIASTLVGTDGARYYDGSSTDSSSTEINAFSEDELDDEDHDGMNYHLILHQNRANENDQDDPLVQESKFDTRNKSFLILKSSSSCFITHHTQRPSSSQRRDIN